MPHPSEGRLRPRGATRRRGLGPSTPTSTSSSEKVRKAEAAEAAEAKEAEAELSLPFLVIRHGTLAHWQMICPSF